MTKQLRDRLAGLVWTWNVSEHDNRYLWQRSAIDTFTLWRERFVLDISGQDKSRVCILKIRTCDRDLLASDLAETRFRVLYRFACHAQP